MGVMKMMLGFMRRILQAYANVIEKFTHKRTQTCRHKNREARQMNVMLPCILVRTRCNHPLIFVRMDLTLTIHMFDV